MAIGFDDLSSDVQDMITKLEVEVHQMKFEANFYRAATLFVFVLLTERIWHYFF